VEEEDLLRTKSSGTVSGAIGLNFRKMLVIFNLANHGKAVLPL
jgi:hypothetical protein